MSELDHTGVKLQSAVKHGRDGTPYVVQRALDGQWRAILFVQEPSGETWDDEDVRERSRWYDDRSALERWLKRKTRRIRSHSQSLVVSSHRSG